MEFSRGKVIDHNTDTSFSIHHQREEVVFRIKSCLVPKALVEEGIEDNPSGMVRSIAGPLHRLLSVIPGMATEVSLGDLSLGCATERNSHVLQLIDDPRRILDQDLDGILIPQIVASFDRIVEMPFPMILLLIAQWSSNSALGCSGMRSRGENFADDRHIGLADALDRCPKSCQTGSHNDDIVLEDHFDRSSTGM